MKTAFFNQARIRQVLTVLLLSGALACIFPPLTPEFQWWGQKNVAVAIGYVGLGLFFLFFNNARLMFVCLGCGAAISFHYHEKAERAARHEISIQPAKTWEMPADTLSQGKPAALPSLPPSHESASPSQ